MSLNPDMICVVFPYCFEKDEFEPEKEKRLVQHLKRAKKLGKQIGAVFSKHDYKNDFSQSIIKKFNPLRGYDLKKYWKNGPNKLLLAGAHIGFKSGDKPAGFISTDKFYVFKDENDKEYHTIAECVGETAFELSKYNILFNACNDVYLDTRISLWLTSKKHEDHIYRLVTGFASMALMSVEKLEDIF